MTLLAHGLDLPPWCGVALALPFGKAVVYHAVLRAIGNRSPGHEIECAAFRATAGVGCGALGLLVAASFGALWVFPISLWVLRAFAWGFAWQETCRTERGTRMIIALGLIANVLIDVACGVLLGFAPGFGLLGLRD